MLAKSLLPSMNSHQPSPPTLKEEKKTNPGAIAEAIRPQTGGNNKALQFHVKKTMQNLPST